MPLRLHVVVLILCAVRLLQCTAGAVTFTWVGGGANDWFNTNNWSPAGLPALNDTVNFNTGVINFTAPVTFVGQFNWTGGTLSGSPLTIGTNGTLAISANPAKSLFTTLRNSGTVVWTGGNLQVEYSSANGQYGSIENLAGGFWDVQNNLVIQNSSPNGAFFQNAGILRKSVGASTANISIPFTNSGVVSNIQGTLQFNGGGRLGGAFNAASGTTINFANGAFSYGSPPLLTGSGAIRLSGGSLTLDNNTIPNLQLAGGTVTLGAAFQGGTITNLALLGGTLLGDNVVSGIFTNGGILPGGLRLLAGANANWSGGYISGPVNIAAGATLNITGSTTKQLFSGLTNAGTVIWGGSGDLEVTYSSAANAFGLIENLPGALWDIQSNENMRNAVATGAYFRNAGMFRKSVGASTTSISIPFFNTGNVTNLSGTLSFGAGGEINGIFAAGAGTTIQFNNGNFSFTTPPTLFGPGAVLFNGGTLTLLNNTIPNLQIGGGTLTLATNFQGGTITNLTVAGGTINGNLTVSGLFNVSATMPGGLRVLNGATVNWTGGSISGPVNVAAGGTLNITGGSGKSLWNSLTNAGTVTWSGNGNLAVDYSSPVSRFGLIENLPGALWDIQNRSLMANSAPNGAYFRNAGMLRKSADTGSATIQIPFHNSGSVTCLVGMLTFRNGGTIQGNFTASAGASIDFNIGTFEYSTPPIMTGPGDIELTGGALTLLNDIIPNLQLAGGTVSLSPGFQGGSITNLTQLAGTLTGNNVVKGMFNFTGTLPGSLTLLNGATVNWSGGTISGPVNIPTNATLNLIGDGNKALWNALTNAGRVTWSGLGQLLVDNSSADSRFGLIENLAPGTWDIQNSRAMDNSFANGAYFRNAGRFVKSADAGTTTISIPFFNTGVVTNLVGIISFRDGGTIQGLFYADAGATINFNLGNFSYGVPPMLLGPGTIQITGNANIMLANTLSNLQLNGGNITLGPGFQGGTISNLTLLGGTLNGNIVVSGLFTSGASMPGSLTVLNGAAATWTGGSISGPVNVAAGGTLNINGGSAKSLWNALTNAGTVIWSGIGNLQVDYSTAASRYGLIQNLAGALWEIRNSQFMLNSFPNSAYFNNAGTVRKTNDSGTSIISIPYFNPGTTEAMQGTMQLNGSASLEGGTLVNGIGTNNGYGQFTIAGNATLTGTLNVVYTGGYAPALSNTFTLVNYGSRTGVFSPLNLPNSSQWLTNYDATALTLTVAAIKKLAVLSGPVSTNAGATLAPLVVQVRDAFSNAVIPTNGLPLTVSIANGTGTLSGTLVRNTVNGQATFDDLSIDKVGDKILRVAAPGTTPTNHTIFTIAPTVATRLGLATPIPTPQRDGGVFQPLPVVLVLDAFGNVVPNSTATITAQATATGSGVLSGATSVNANGFSGSATFTNLFYLLGNKLAAETVTVRFTSPGLAPVTNSPVLVNFVFGVITLQHGNSVVKIEPRTQQGVFSWTVDGVQRLYQQWFWVRRDNGPQRSFDSLGQPIGVSVSANTATINYITAGMDVELSLALQGGTAGSMASDLVQSIAIQNTGSTAMFHVYQYSDFEMSGAADNDIVAFTTASHVVQSGSSAMMTESVSSPLPSFYEGSFYALTLNKIVSAAPATLSNTLIPPNAGDQTFGYQWTTNLAAGQTVMIDYTQRIRPLGPTLLSITLRIASAGTNVVLSWPTNGAAMFQLQRVSTLSGVWTNLGVLPATSGTNYQVTVPRSGNIQFYRLKN